MKQTELIAGVLESVEKLDGKGKTSHDAITDSGLRREKIKSAVLRLAWSTTLDPIFVCPARTSVSTVTSSSSWFSFVSQSSIHFSSTTQCS